MFLPAKIVEINMKAQQFVDFLLQFVRMNI